MFEKIINYIKRLFGKEEPLKIEDSKEIIENIETQNGFQNNLKDSTSERMRLLSLQKNLSEGKIKEEDLDANDIKPLRELYYEQIYELANSIAYYQNKLNAQ